jgi:hypothetical protein
MNIQAVLSKQRRAAELDVIAATITAAPEKTGAVQCLGFANWDLNEADADQYEGLLNRADNAFGIELDLEAKLAGAARETKQADAALYHYKRTFYSSAK